eukprot:750920-Hanusia_phi.AAC.3
MFQQDVTGLSSSKGSIPHTKEYKMTPKLQISTFADHVTTARHLRLTPTSHRKAGVLDTRDYFRSSIVGRAARSLKLLEEHVITGVDELNDVCKREICSREVGPRARRCQNKRLRDKRKFWGPANLILHSASINMFSGFKSLWTTCQELRLKNAEEFGQTNP